MGKNKNRERARKLLEMLLDGSAPEDVEESLKDISPKVLGALGEELAAWYLGERGYVIVDRNYRCPEGEADIVAFDEESGEVVLVEVKTRREHIGIDSPYPEEAVTSQKQQRYRRIAYCYAAEHYPIPALRFDVIAVGIELDSTARRGSIRHLCRAFDWEADQ